MTRKESVFHATPLEQSLTNISKDVTPKSQPSLTPTSRSLPGLGPLETSARKRSRKTSVLKVIQVGSKSGRFTTQDTPLRKAETMKTPLQVAELQMAADVWNRSVSSGFVTSLVQLNTLLDALQVPQQPIISNLIKEKFSQRSHFSYQDFLFLLEQCKTIHIRWLHKVQGKALDDDLLDAFVAMGGEEDSGGEVDMEQMKKVIGDFQLKVDLVSIVPTATVTVGTPVAKQQQQFKNQPTKNLHFTGFAQLLKNDGKLPPLKGPGGSTSKSNANYINSDAYLMVDDTDAGMPTKSGSMSGAPLLSTMEFFEEDIEVGVDGIVRHRAPDPQAMRTSKSLHFGGDGRMNRQASNLGLGKSIMGGAGDGRMHRQGSNLGLGKSMSGFGTNVTSPTGIPRTTEVAATPDLGNTAGSTLRGKKKGVQRVGNGYQFGSSDNRSPPRSNTTEPGASSSKASRAASPSKLQPIRQIHRGPKKPKYANW